MNLAVLLEMAAAGFPDRTAVLHAGDRLSVAELAAAATATADRVREAGATHVALLDEASLAAPIALFGAAAAGVPYAPLSYRLTDAEIEARLAQLAPALLVVAPERAKDLEGVAGAEVVARDRFLREVRGAPTDAPLPTAAEGDDVAVLLFTSGTSGPPKAAVLRHRHLVAYLLGSVEFGSAGEDEASLVSVPPYHVAGVAALLSSLYAGRRVVQLPRFDANDWLDHVDAHAVTHAFVVPTMLARVIDALERRGTAPTASLRHLAYGGGRMPQTVIEGALRRWPETDFTNAYGLTETSSTIALLGPEDHRLALASGDPAVRRRLVSAGRPLPSVEIEIRDARGRAVGPGATGAIFVRGEQISGEYRGGAPKLDDDGWFETRDGGHRDADGYLFVEGRLDDVIVRGGENLSPGEIEEVLRTHPDVSDAAVVGLPDAEWGERVAAIVVPRAGASPDPAVLRDHVRARLRSARVPDPIAFRDALPYNETGKLVRRHVRAMLLDET